ncbi:MAG: DUF1707 domain-containing protein [Micromonosporaceae bacterium]|nr:DUF1707 domain-containing protein [Micromonosporaceae bacterium]
MSDQPGPEQPAPANPPAGPDLPAPAGAEVGGDRWRPSEPDRRAVADRLRQAVDEGRLDLLEYDQRLRTAETATSLAELDRVLADLPSPAEPVLLQIGELAITRTTVFTPAGPIPLRGSHWTDSDHWVTERKIPTWAIVVAVVGFFLVCALSLLFLLAKETHYHGVVDVTVSNRDKHYVARIPVYSLQQVHHLHQQVGYVRTLTAG